jgi:hypothetical protein
MLLSDMLTPDDWLLASWVAGRHGVDPLLLVAIGWRETNWGRQGAGRLGWHLGYGYYPGSPVLEQYRGLRNQLEGTAAQLARDLGPYISLFSLRRFARESWRPGDPNAWSEGVWRTYSALSDDLSRLFGEEPRLVRHGPVETPRGEAAGGDGDPVQTEGTRAG